VGKQVACKLVHVKADRICRICGSVILKGEKAYRAKGSKGKYRYECLKCHRNCGNSNVFIYSPNFKAWWRRVDLPEGPAILFKKRNG